MKKFIALIVLSTLISSCDDVSKGMDALDALEESTNQLEVLEALEPVPTEKFRPLFPEKINNVPKDFGSDTVTRYAKSVIEGDEPRYEYTMVIQDLANPGMTAFILEFQGLDALGVNETDKDGNKLVYTKFKGYPRLNSIPMENGVPSIKVLVENRFILILNGQWDSTYEQIDEAINRIDIGLLTSLAQS
ncbi:hypothetical protein [Aliikangiella sp. G2MR2-5]|uniref:hypothetical protein n=1 Tax=Aliikangiella sp. G2MR2-5 TaxID=2788943 RepID=UPI0018AB023E|nr:hypothetical protein [Aliikangiella sp. G2MR2-5]